MLAQNNNPMSGSLGSNLGIGGGIFGDNPGIGGNLGGTLGSITGVNGQLGANSMGGLMGGSAANSQYSSIPGNYQLPNYTGMAPSIASGLMGLVNAAPQINPTVGGITGTNFNLGSQTGNPLLAGLTPQQLASLGGLPNASNNPNLAGSMQTLGQIGNMNFINPSSNPFLASAIKGAVDPMVTAFNASTMPAMTGQFTAAGQKTSGAQPGGGSSAFDTAASLAQKQLEQSIGQVTSGMENQNYQTGVQNTQNAAIASGNLTSGNLNNMIQTLNAQSLPQLVQQYGINQGLQVYQQRMQMLLQVLGLGGQISQPVIANTAQSTSQNNQTQGLLSGVGSLFGGSGGAGGFMGAFGL